MLTELFLLDIAGHIAYIFVLFGLWLLTKKSKWGFVSRFIGELGWVIIGIIMGMTSIWTWGLAFMTVDVVGYWRWREEKYERQNSK